MVLPNSLRPLIRIEGGPCATGSSGITPVNPRLASGVVFDGRTLSDSRRCTDARASFNSFRFSVSMSLKTTFLIVGDS